MKTPTEESQTRVNDEI